MKKNLFMRLWEKIKENQRKNSEEYLEEEEFDKFIENIERRMDKIPSAKKALTKEGQAQVALMFENAYTQKKVTEVNESLKTATWILAIATGIFAYVAVMDSVNSGTIILNLKVLGFIVLLIILAAAAIEILKGIIKFIFKLVWKRFPNASSLKRI